MEYKIEYEDKTVAGFLFFVLFRNHFAAGHQ